MNYAPVAIFVYNRPIHTKKTLEALSKNIGISETDLFIFSDGPKKNASYEDIKAIEEIRTFSSNINFCRKVNVIKQSYNIGLANSIINGVTEIIKKYGKIIVLEDDIITNKYYLQYSNNALNMYENHKDVWHISGWTYPVKTTKYNSAFFWNTMNCWGWATWADRWNYFKKDAKYYINTFNKDQIKKINIMNSEDFWSQIIQNYNKNINTWAIFWYCTIFEHKGLCLSPFHSLTYNIGIDGSGTNCTEAYYYQQSIDNTIKINDFPKKIKRNIIQIKKIECYLKNKNKKDILSLFNKYILKPCKRLIKKLLLK